MTRASLYVSDMDGTLLRDDATLSGFARETLTRLLGDGLPLTVASARSGETMREILGDLPLQLPIVEFNGAILSDFGSGRRMAVHDIESEPKRRLLDLMQSHGHLPFLSTYDGQTDRLYYGETTNDGAAWYLRDRIAAGDPRLTRRDSPDQGLQDQVVCMTLVDSEERIRSMESLIRNGCSQGISVHCFQAKYEVGWYWMTVQSDRATKEHAVRALMAEIGCDAGQVATFGDEVNDVGMLEVAGRGIAMANAVPEVMAVADQVIGSNQDDSVVRFLQEDWGS